MMEYADSSVYFSFTFTQQDIDNVLYGYIRTPEKVTNGFALSGIYINTPSNGKHAQLRTSGTGSGCRTSGSVS